MAMMKAAVFVEPGRIELQEKPIPEVGPNDALLRITTTTICGTDVHILKGEYPVARGLTIGHEPVGIIEKLGSNVKGYQEGQRVIAGAICPSFTSYACQDGVPSQDGGCSCHGYKPMGGWRFGNSIDGVQAEYALVPDAQANLAPIPDGLSDEQVLMCPDIMSTGFAGAEAAHIRIGDIVAVFAQGPIGLCATAGARLRGASSIIVVDGVDQRLEVARRMGADVTLIFRNVVVVDEILKLTGGRGVDASIEALGTQTTFEQALRVLMMAQRTADDHVSDARREADQLLSEARSKAEEVTREARAKADALERDARQRHQEAMGGLDAKRTALQKHIEELKQFEREYRTRLKAYLESQLRDLDGRGQGLEVEMNREGNRATGSNGLAAAGLAGSYGGGRAGSLESGR